MRFTLPQFCVVMDSADQIIFYTAQRYPVTSPFQVVVTVEGRCQKQSTFDLPEHRSKPCRSVKMTFVAISHSAAIVNNKLSCECCPHSVQALNQGSLMVVASSLARAFSISLIIALFASACLAIPSTCRLSPGFAIRPAKLLPRVRRLFWPWEVSCPNSS